MYSQPFCKETKLVSIPFPEPGAIQGDELSSIISPWSRLSNYTVTRDEESEEECKPTGKPEKELDKQGTIDKQGLL